MKIVKRLSNGLSKFLSGQMGVLTPVRVPATLAPVSPVAKRYGSVAIVVWVSSMSSVATGQRPPELTRKKSLGAAKTSAQKSWSVGIGKDLLHHTNLGPTFKNMWNNTFVLWFIRCFKTCHRGECGDRKLCKKKVKVYCSCKRVKQDVQCNKAADFVVSCKSDCEEAKKVIELNHWVLLSLLKITHLLSGSANRGHKICKYWPSTAFLGVNTNQNEPFLRSYLGSLLNGFAHLIFCGCFSFGRLLNWKKLQRT